MDYVFAEANVLDVATYMQCLSGKNCVKNRSSWLKNTLLALELDPVKHAKGRW